MDDPPSPYLFAGLADGILATLGGLSIILPARPGPLFPHPACSVTLGKLKHAAAFECIQRRLAEKFPDNFAVEPRYRKDEFTKEVLLTDRRTGSLRPDIVIHFTRNATRIQCIYDLKFPCGYEVGNPWNAEVVRQMKSYAGLGGQCEPALVTPQLGVDRR